MVKCLKNNTARNINMATFNDICDFSFPFSVNKTYNFVMFLLESYNAAETRKNFCRLFAIFFCYSRVLAEFSFIINSLF